MLGKLLGGRTSAESGPYNEADMLRSIAGEALSEQKKARRWGVFFKLLTFAYLFIILTMFYTTGSKGFVNSGSSDTHTALIRIDGVIAADQQASANRAATGLRKAFENENAKAILIAINSPGGSPVQAGYINDEIARLRLLHPEKPVYASIADLGASGGYYIAAAADEIYADKASLVGSIGVTASSFGFVEAMGKMGVERRHFTAGEHKSFLDPFSPLKPAEIGFWKEVLANTHEQFIDVVKRGRGDRLNFDVASGGLDEKTMFSGLIWNGEQALELGLIDGLGSAGYVARDVVGAEDIVDYTVRDSPLKELTRQLGASVGVGIARSMGVGSPEAAPLSLR